MKRHHWLLLLGFALVGAGLLLLFGCGRSGLFGIFEPPDPNATADVGGSGGSDYTPFARDLRSVMIPLVWACILFGGVSIVLSRWIGVFSAKAGATAIALGIGLLLAVSYLIKYEWVVDVAVIGSLAIAALLLGHMVYLKLRGKEGSEPSQLFPAFVRAWFAKPAPPTGA